MASAPRDEDRVVVIQGVSAIDLVTPVTIAVNSITNAILVEIL